MQISDIIKATIGREGTEYENDPCDKGGETKFGITWPVLKEAQQKNLVLVSVTIKNLTLADAQKIYKLLYWDAMQLDEISDMNISAKIFDLAVNIGIKWAVVCLQRAMRAAAFCYLVEDGILGPKTKKLLNEFIKFAPSNSNILLAALKSEAAGYYRSLQNSHYQKGWLNRAYS